jgi:ParB/RepB/Spo0J family partition protein
MAESSNMIVKVPLSLIDVDYSFNVRRKHDQVSKGEDGKDLKVEAYRGIEDLAADMKRDGQITPVLVRSQANGRYFLVAGFRRYDAASSLGWQGIDALVRDMDDLRAAILNAKENTSRDGLTIYELATRCAELQDKYGLTQARIASEFAAGTDYRGEGMSRSYIGNLIRCVKNLHPTILEAWRNDDPNLTTDLLVKWSAEEHEEQIEHWNTKRGVTSEEPEGEGTEGEGEGSEEKAAKKGERKTSLAQIVAAQTAVEKRTDLDPDARAAFLAAFAFVTGKAKSLRFAGLVIYDPEVEQATRKAEKEAERAAEKEAKAAEKAAEKAAADKKAAKKPTKKSAKKGAKK